MVFSWKISGEAGFGITTIGLTAAKIVTRRGLYAFGYAEYPSLIRGGFTTYELTVSDAPMATLKETLDVLVCLRQDGFDRDKHRLHPASVVLFDKDTVKVEGDFVAIPLPLKEIRTKHKAFQVMANVVSLGATLAVFGWDLQSFEKLVSQEFARKGQEVIDHNRTLAKEGYDYVVQLIGAQPELAQKLKQFIVNNSIIKDHPQEVKAYDTMVLSGSDAFSLGSVIADCRAYYAYPMSPSSTALTTLAAWAKKTGMVVRHVEDEIAVISEALGSSFAGVRASVGTSGGGFALMVESISYAGVAELPIVIYLAQRPGPATGLPTWTGQGDLLFAVNAGHGEFPKIVLSPGDVQEMIELTSEAYNLADIYQTAVILITEKMMAESHHSLPSSWLKSFESSYQVDRGNIVTATTQNPYLRYKNSETGISEALIPGLQEGVWWQANSYEHTEDSHTTEEAPDIVLQVEKRKKKTATYLKKHFKGPKVYGNLDESKVVFVSYGSNKPAILYAQSILSEQGIKTAFLHFTHIYPLSLEIIKPYFDKKAVYVLIENSLEGQFGKLLKQEIGVEIEKQLLRYDGRPITADDIVKFVSSNK